MEKLSPKIGKIYMCVHVCVCGVVVVLVMVWFVCVGVCVLCVCIVCCGVCVCVFACVHVCRGDRAVLIQFLKIKM